MKVLHATVEHEGVTYQVTRSPNGIEVVRGDTLVAWMSGWDPLYSVRRQRERANREWATAALMEAVLDQIGVEP